MLRNMNTLRVLAVCGIIAPVLFTGLVVIVSYLRPGYNHMSQAISELGEVGAPNAIVQDVNFVLVGLLIIAFSFGLHRGIGEGRGSKVGPALIIIFGAVASVGGGLFRCDPGCVFESFVGVMHNLLGLTGFVAMILGTIIISRRLKKDSLWQSYSSYSIITGILAIIFLILFIMASNVFPEWRGLFQRLFVGVIFLWIEIMAIRLLLITNKLVPQDSHQN